jgi:hypothetical protein
MLAPKRSEALIAKIQNFQNHVISWCFEHIIP